MFLMNSDSKDISIWFLHFNLNLSELRKTRETKWHDQLKIIYKPRTFLSTIERAKPIHLEEKLKPFRTIVRRDVRNLKGKVLYMLDWNDSDQLRRRRRRIDDQAGYRPGVAGMSPTNSNRNRYPT